MQFMCIHLSITIIEGSQLHFPANNNTALACVATKLHQGGGEGCSVSSKNICHGPKLC